MERLIVLGTGAARAVRYYNTCFLLEGDQGRILVDGGGGNGIFRRLEAAGKSLNDIDDIFATHEHIDHILGIIWIIRMSATAWLSGRRTVPLRIHCHSLLAEKLRTICELTLSRKQGAVLGTGVVFLPAHDGEKRTIAGHEVTFFDIASKKAMQFGMHVESQEGQRILFCGDEPYRGRDRALLHGTDWVFHEAFCLQRHDSVFNPHRIGHSTVLDAASVAASVGAGNLVLWHTEDSETVGTRKELYSEEARRVFSGGIFVPEDLDVIALR
ncbi:MAG: MBL fold metallo-hydrolase [Mailhella sp.]|nr:MBL fold metallo-hydrolase [Mailhella sp.]